MSHEHYYTLSSHFGLLQTNKNLTIDAVGQKAIGLLNTSPLIVPPFIVLTSELFKLWHDENQESAEEILNIIIVDCIKYFQSKDTNKFIIRSSAKYESFEERGHYTSSIGNLDEKELIKTIKEIWYNNAHLVKKIPDNRFSVIIQKYIKPMYSGHLSNERRISRERKSFLYEIVNSKDIFLKSGKFSTTSEDITIAGPLKYTTQANLVNTIKSIGNCLYDNVRRHIEWVADKNNVWVVQNDIENPINDKHTPSSRWLGTQQLIENKKLSCFVTLAESPDWKKTACIKTFLECKLPYGQIHVLENKEIIADLAKNIVLENLKADLEWLLKSPIVIRMDIKNPDGYNNILLPRTETLFDIDSAINFLTLYAQKFSNNKDEKLPEFCFLIHRFINSKACALAYSKPGIPRARVDSTWGIVEGLYYYPHDSFEVNLTEVKDRIKKKIRCKTEYLDVDEVGNWISIKTNSDYDWAESLTQKQLNEIAEYNSKIADKLGLPVTAMYFVDVDKNTGYPSILPWFYTTDEITSNSEKFTDIIFSEVREIIQNPDDFRRLGLKLQGAEKKKFTIKLKLNINLLRDKDFIEQVGHFAADGKIPIELEGSILSHTYYILRKTGAIVKCVDSFDPTYEKQKFYKLVRDKIAVNISSKGEIARTVNIETSQMLDFLKEKAIEEALEFFWENDKDKIIEEMADIYEILRSACKLFGIDMTELNEIADKKNKNKGGFDTGLLLVDTSEASLIETISVDDVKAKNNKPTINKSLKLNRERFKITANTEREMINIPYIIGGFQKNNNPKQLKYTIPYNDKIIEIIYSTRGIRINLDKEKNDKNPSQLDLFAEIK